MLVRFLLRLSDPPSSSSCSGPDGVKMENADGAVATVAGLKVGTYEFTLTVTDDRKLQHSDTVTVVVREGELQQSWRSSRRRRTKLDLQTSKTRSAGPPDIDIQN